MKTKALLLLVIFAATGFLKLALTVNYVLKFERYASVLCVNKSKPELHCNGSCVFMQEMGIVSAGETGSNQEKPEPPENENHLQSFEISRHKAPGFYEFKSKTKATGDFDMFDFKLIERPFKPPECLFPSGEPLTV